MPVVEIGLWLAAVGSALLVVARVTQWVGARDRARLAAADEVHARDARTRTEARLPGATPTGAIEITSAAAVEPRAEALPCPRCGGRCHVHEHVVHETHAMRLRRAAVRCGGCGHERDVFLRIRAPN